MYGVRLIPESTLKGVDEATLKLADGSTAGLTLHTFDGTIPQLRRSLDRSLDAFFDLLPARRTRTSRRSASERRAEEAVKKSRERKGR